jgi:ketosteroid isomerase-like protein
MKKTMAVLMVICCAGLTGHAFAQDADKATGDAIIAMVKAQWAAEMKDPNSVTEQMKDASDDYTEFNGQYATRIEGKAANSRLGEAAAKDVARTIAAEMLNPKVQVYNGDTAIVTYNYAGLTLGKDGKTEATRAKSTRVFVKKDSKWVMVHANFGPDPMPKQ